MIESFRVQNYKALRDVEVKLTPMHVLIGPNDSGKTSVLEALGALCRSVDLPLEAAFSGPWSGSDLVWGRKDEPVRFEARLEAPLEAPRDVIDYRLECRFFGHSRQVQAILEASGRQGEAQEDLLVPNTRQMGVSMVCAGREGDPSVPGKTGLLRRIHDVLSGAQYYRWNPRFLALPNAQGAQDFQMDPSGFGLTLCLDDILGYDRNGFDEIEQRFREIFPDITSIKLLRETGFAAASEDAMGVPMLRSAAGKGLYFEFASTKTLVPAAQVSDGVLLVLAYLAVLYSPRRPRVLMVEEPENGVHPKRLKDVLRILRELVGEQSHTQVLMTTHSPYVLDEFKPEEVSLCQKGADGAVTIHRLSESKAVREQLDVFSLGEIWTAEGDEALARDGGNGVEKKQ